MTTLDKTKPYGTICGTFGLAKFEQGGQFFDNQGILLGDDGFPLKPKTGSTRSNTEPSGNTVTGQTNVPPQPPVSNEFVAPGAEQFSEPATRAAAPAAVLYANEKDALVARAKELKIPSAHMMGVEKLKAKIAEAEAAIAKNEPATTGALSVDQQLAENLGETSENAGE